MVTKLEEIIGIAKRLKKKRLAVAAAADDVVIKAVNAAVEDGIIDAILIGDKDEIYDILKLNSIDSKKFKIVHCEDAKKSAEIAVELFRNNEADFIMKGLINTKDLLKAVLNKETGIKESSVLSHVMVYSIPSYHKLLLLTDGGMVMYPELSEKVAIINNSLKVTKALQIENPKIAPLCAVENVNPAMNSTVDASMLSTMNKRGQIKGCIIDGPLALDNAISKEAATHKGIESEVSGECDILLVPNIEAGNLLGKSITYFGNGIGAGVIIGAKCPIVLVSRADSEKTKLYSIALGAII